MVQCAARREDMSSPTTYVGTLLFTGSGYIKPGEEYRPRPWRLVRGDGSELDLRPVILSAMRAMEGKKASQARGLDSYCLLTDEKSPVAVKIFPDQDDYTFPILSGIGQVSSIIACLDDSLIWLTGRRIQIRVSENSVAIHADRKESVYQVRPRVNSAADCPVPNLEAVTVCGVGTQNRCVFSGQRDDGEYFCYKFSCVPARARLEAFAEGQMRPDRTRIGNCSFASRKEEAVSA